MSTGTENAPPGLTTETPPTTPTTPEAPKVEAADPPKVEAKPEEVKPEEVKTEAPAPLTIKDISVPEGYTLDEKLAESALGIMNDEALAPKDRLQKLVDLQAAREKSIAEEGMKAFEALQEKWVEAIKSDKDFGGAKFDETLSSIGKLFEKYADAETREALDVTGAGNNPLVFRMMARIAKDLTEPGPVSGSPGTSGGDLASKLYTTMGTNQ